MPPRSAEAGALVVDARGMRCPWPVLRAARAMRDANHITLIADDPIALTDVPALAKAQGWHCVIETAAEGTRFTLTKGIA